MKEQLEDLFKTLDHQIDVCRSSIFTRNDVKIMYNGLLPEILQVIDKNAVIHLPKIHEQILEELQDLIQRRFETALSQGYRDFVDYSSAEFELEYDNKIVLNRVDLNECELSEAIAEAVHGAFEQTFKIEENESE
jgi:hypothetical protein